MAPSEWNQVVDLFHAVLEKPVEQRSSLLEQMCGEQTLLRKAVEDLLDRHDSCSGFLSEPILSTEEGGDCTELLSPQQRFERFVLLDMVGRGGMGDVWSALDTELDRRVALKFLRAGTASVLDTARITREAKAASALNHPNIVTIHEVVRSGQCSAIVMEMVQGRALASLRGAALPFDEVLSVGTQLAKALEAAHTHSIVHGDIKPENIILREDGYVKVLDFGLAHRLATETSGVMRGSVFGTPRYVSPEQALGEPLTPASDIFSFGLVLFELATGAHPFAGESPLDALRAILKTDPPSPASVNPQLPPAFCSLVLRMLAKDTARRPHASNVAEQLSEIRSISLEQESPETPSAQVRSSRLSWLIPLSLCLLAVGAGAWFFLGKRDRTEFSNLNIEPLTSQAGFEASPAFSPDGRSVAFTWSDRRDSPPQIYVKQLPDGSPVELTDPHEKGTIGSLVWSPDGKWLAYKRGYKSSGAILAMLSSGGKEKKIVDLKSPYASTRIDWSPDGNQLAFSDFMPHTELMALYLSDLKSGKKREMTSPPADVAGDWNPRFSPDGRTIAFKRVSGFWSDDMYTIQVTGGQPQRVTWDRRGILGHVWTPDGKSLIVSCQRGSTTFGLWRFPLASPTQPERVVQGGVDAVTPAICWNTARLAWVNQRQDLNIYRVPMTGGSQPVKLIASTVRDQDPEYSPSGNIAFVSDRSGSREIWLARADGTDQRRMTNFSGPDIGDLQWSPDGRHLAFYVSAQGHSDIFALDCDPAGMRCENPKRMTAGVKAAVPNWSADGDFLYFASDRSGPWEIWKQPISGGLPVQVTRNGGYVARESPDRKWLYFSKVRGYGIWRIPAHGNGDEEVVVDPSYNVEQKGWALTPDEIIFTGRAEEGLSSALRAFRISTKRTRVILSSVVGFADTRDYGLTVSPDSKWILYPQLEESDSNIMLAESR